jgi:hypothetical protein
MSRLHLVKQHREVKFGSLERDSVYLFLVPGHLEMHLRRVWCLERLLLHFLAAFSWSPQLDIFDSPKQKPNNLSKQLYKF